MQTSKWRIRPLIEAGTIASHRGLHRCRRIIEESLGKDMAYEPLSAQARTVFEWIARHVESKVCFWFAEVRTDCDIGTDHELHALLLALQEYPKRVGSRWAIVEAIYPEEEHGEGAFEVCAHADRAWAEYRAWEDEHLCPDCREPALEKVVILRCATCGHEHDLSPPQNT